MVAIAALVDGDGQERGVVRFQSTDRQLVDTQLFVALGVLMVGTETAILADALYKGVVKIAVASGQIQQAMNQTRGKSGWAGVNWRVDNVDRFGRPKADHCVPLCGYGPASFLYEALGLPVPSGVKPDEYGYRRGCLELGERVAQELRH